MRRNDILCPVCKVLLNENGNCGCMQAFSLYDIPEESLSGIARTILPYITAFFQNPENRAWFEAWLPEYEKRKSEGAGR